MATLMDLDGFTAVRVSIPEGVEDGATLTLFCPESADDHAQSYTIAGLGAIIALRNAIEEEVSRASMRAELALEDIPQ